MKKWFGFLLLLLVVLLSACSNNDELSGKTLRAVYMPPPWVQMDDATPNQYDYITTLEFLDGNVVSKAIQDGEGKYELNGDELVLRFENENERLEITVTESDKEFSEYSAVISDVDFDITDTDKVSHYQNLFLKLSNKQPIEFLKEDYL